MRAKGLGANIIITEANPFKALEATMDSCRVMAMDEAAPLGDIFITATGCKQVITAGHFEKMKNNAFLANAGHFDCEIDKKALRAMSAEIFERRNNIEGYYLKDGRILNLLAEGRLVNLASGNGHPAEIMDLSFAIQALSVRWIVDNGRGLKRGVYEVPESIDNEVALIKLKSMGMTIDKFTEEQKAILSRVGSIKNPINSRSNTNETGEKNEKQGIYI